MKRKSVIFVGVVAVGLGGLALSRFFFSREPQWVTQTWQEGQPIDDFPAPPNFSEPAREEPLLELTLTLQTQTVAGVPVEGAYFKIIRRQGRAVWAKAHFLEPQNLPSTQRVQRDLQRLTSVQSQSEILQDDLDCKMRTPLRPILRWRLGAFRLLFTRGCENPRGEIFEVAFNSRGRLLSQDSVGSHFQSETARITLFPKGPKLSHLEKTEVAIAPPPAFLLTPKLEVTSDAGVKIENRDTLESLRPEDPAFDLVQAYFFSSGALQWAEQHLKIHIEPIKVRTHVGYPEKGNVAFYYGREIRLGEGDDVTFSKIAWDPSIVVHEVMHGVIESLTGLPFKGEPGSLQEAYADSLTALYLDTPQMGSAAYKAGPYQRTLENDKKLQDRAGKMYADSLIISGTVWEIKRELGDAAAMDLLAFLLSRGTPNSGFADVQKDLQAWLAACALGERCDRIGSVLSRRGWL